MVPNEATVIQASDDPLSLCSRDMLSLTDSQQRIREWLLEVHRDTTS